MNSTAAELVVLLRNGTLHFVGIIARPWTTKHPLVLRLETRTIAFHEEI